MARLDQCQWVHEIRHVTKRDASHSELSLLLLQFIARPNIQGWQLDFLKSFGISLEQILLIPRKEIQKSVSRVAKTCEEVYNSRLADASTLGLSTRYANAKVADIISGKVRIDSKDADGSNAADMLDLSRVYDVLHEEIVRLLMIAGASKETADKVMSCIVEC